MATLIMAYEFDIEGESSSEEDEDEDEEEEGDGSSQSAYELNKGQSSFLSYYCLIPATS